MNDKAGDAGKRRFPFLDHIGLAVREQEPGSSTCALTVAPFHFNSSGLVHGAVIFALADTGMGAALYAALEKGQHCATIEIKIVYLRPVTEGHLICRTTLIQKTRRFAVLESEVKNDDRLVAKAMGTFAIIEKKQ